jgi:hypothetical protein
MSTPRKAPARVAAKPAAKAAPKTTVAKAAPKAAAKPATKAAPKAPAKPVAKRPAAKAASKPAPKAAAKPAISTEKRYKFLSGIDDGNFCQRVSDHLDAGYELYGSPTMVVKGAQVYVGQAIVLKKAVKAKKKGKK